MGQVAEQIDGHLGRFTSVVAADAEEDLRDTGLECQGVADQVQVLAIRLQIMCQ